MYPNLVKVIKTTLQNLQNLLCMNSNRLIKKMPTMRTIMNESFERIQDTPSQTYLTWIENICQICVMVLGAHSNVNFGANRSNNNTSMQRY